MPALWLPSSNAIPQQCTLKRYAALQRQLTKACGSVRSSLDEEGAVRARSTTPVLCPKAKMVRAHLREAFAVQWFGDDASEPAGLQTFTCLRLGLQPVWLEVRGAADAIPWHRALHSQPGGQWHLQCCDVANVLCGGGRRADLHSHRVLLHKEHTGVCSWRSMLAGWQ